MMHKPGDSHIMPDAGACRVDPGETAVLDIYFSIPPDTAPGKYVFTWIIYMGLSKVMASSLTKSDTLMIYALGEEPNYNPLADPLILVPAAVIMLFVIYLLTRRRSKSSYLPEAPPSRRRDRIRPQRQ